MEHEKEMLFRSYAWSYFSFHADQRMKTFNFFIIIAGVFAGGILTLIKEAISSWIILILGLSLSFLSYLFYRLDQRNRNLVINGESAIRHLDALHKLPAEDKIPHVLCIFEKDNHTTSQKPKSIFKMNSYCSYSMIIRYVLGLFGVVGIVLGVAPFFIARKQTIPQPIIVNITPSTQNQASALSAHSENTDITNKPKQATVPATKNGSTTAKHKK